MANRAHDVTQALIGAVRGVLKEHRVTFDEFRTGSAFLMKTAEANEIMLMVDVFLSTTIVDVENENRKGSSASIQGPYFLEGAPVVTDALAIMDDDKASPRMIMRGKITDHNGDPVSNAVIDVWHSTAGGLYSGIHDNIPLEYYRGKIHTKDDGSYNVESILPVPYQIPNTGPTGELLEKHMGLHSWRPAHIHYWVQADGHRDIISQAYFEGGEYVDGDCCEGVGDDHILPEIVENGVRIMEYDFQLDQVVSTVQAAE